MVYIYQKRSIMRPLALVYSATIGRIILKFDMNMSFGILRKFFFSFFQNFEFWIFSSASSLAEVIKSPRRPSSVVRRLSSVVNLTLFLNRSTDYHEIWYKHVFWDTKEAFFSFFQNFWWFFFDFVNMGVYGAGNFKTLLLRQFLPDQFQIISATTLGGPSQNLLLRILNFAFIDF